jgi:cytochrome oxidase Cu insertion factor (SCO1/SenC/PrrC family)
MASTVEPEPITHSTRLVLVDRTGVIRGYYEADDAKAMARLQQDLRRVLRERS